MCRDSNPHNEAFRLSEIEKVPELQGLFGSYNQQNLHLYTNRTPIYAIVVQLHIKDSVQIITTGRAGGMH